MALQYKSSFLYGLQVTTANRSIDFKISGGGSVLQATVALGYYSLSGLMDAIVAALSAADPSNTYTVTANRTLSSGTQNRVTIATSGAYLSLLFLTGPRTASTIAPLIGFTTTDKTGALTYTGSSSAGTILLPTWYAYNYIPTDRYKKVYGALNVSASGLKEAVVFQLQKFFQVEFMHEPEAKVASDYSPFIDWIIQQRPLEFTPSIASPNTVLDCTLETTEEDGEGLAMTMKEELPDMPFLFGTGLLKFRLKVV